MYRSYKPKVHHKRMYRHRAGEMLAGEMLAGEYLAGEGGEMLAGEMLGGLGKKVYQDADGEYKLHRVGHKHIKVPVHKKGVRYYTKEPLQELVKRHEEMAGRKKIQIKLLKPEHRVMTEKRKQGELLGKASKLASERGISKREAYALVKEMAGERYVPKERKVPKYSVGKIPKEQTIKNLIQKINELETDPKHYKLNGEIRKASAERLSKLYHKLRGEDIKKTHIFMGEEEDVTNPARLAILRKHGYKGIGYGGEMLAGY